MTELIFALIPVRSLSHGKSRLAPAFSGAEREQLVRNMLADVVAAALAVPSLAEVAVISPDPAALALASALDQRVVPVIEEPGREGLNPAIAAGRDRAVGAGADGLLVLFGDLPLIDAAAIREFLSVPAAVVLAPDRHGEGTNASLVRFGGDGQRFEYQYGAGSLARHEAEARRLGLPVSVVAVPRLATDLDTVEDWAVINQHILREGALARPWRGPVTDQTGAWERRGA